MFDEISKKIIRRFQWPRDGDTSFFHRPSPYRIAKELNVHPKVVRSRLKEMYDSGLIRELRFYADDRFMPWKRFFLISQTKGIAKRISDHFKEFPFIERVIYGTLYVPDSVVSDGPAVLEREFTSLSLIAVDEEDLKGKIGLLEGSDCGMMNTLEIIEDSREKVQVLSELECSIVNAILTKNPLTISLNELAIELGIPLRSIRRKVERLLHTGVIYEEVSLDTSKSRWGLVPSVIMVGQYNKWLPAISKSQFLSERLLLYKNFSRFSFFIFHAEDFSAVDDISMEIAKINPVHWVTYRNGSYNNPYVNYKSLSLN